MDLKSEVILSLDKASETDDLDVTRTQAWYVGDITAKPDGTKLYTTNENWYVSEYTLTTAGDLTTATNTHNWSHSLTNPKGIEFNDDGTKVFFAVWNTGNVHEFPLGTAWDLSTIGSQTGTTSNGSIDGQSLRFSTDGMYLFFSDNSGNLLRHDLTSAFTPVNNQQQSVNPSDVNTIYGFDFSTDGKTLISAGSNGAELFEHSLGTAWDLSTLSFVGSKTVVPTNINGVALSNDDSRIWTAEQGTGQGSSGGIDTITQFDVSSTSTLADKSTNNVPITYQASGVFQVTAPMAWDTSTLNGYSVSTVTNTNDKITKTAGNGWNNSGAGTSHSVGTAGSEFSVEFGRDALGGGTMIGLDTSFQSASSLTIPFGIYMAGGYFQVYENGSNVYNPSGSPQASDRFKIEVEDNGTVKYYHDVGGTGSWVLKYTSSGTAVGEYIVRASSWGTGAPVVLGTFTGWQTVTDNDSTTGTIGTAIQDPNLTYTNSNLPDNTDTLSVGGWVKLDPTSYSDSFTSDNWIDNDSTKVGVSSNALQVTLDRDGSIDSSVYDLGTVADNWTLQMKLNFATLGGVDDMGFFGMSTTDESASQNTNGEFIGLVVNDGGLDNRINMCVSYMGNGCGLSQQTFTFSTGTDYYYQLVKTGNSITQTLTTNSDFTGGTSQTQTTSVTGLQYIKVSNLEAGNNDGSTATLTVDDVLYFEPFSGTTKLLGLNDVTFEIGTTTASVNTLGTVAGDFEKTSISSTHSSSGQTLWDLATTSDWNTDSGVYNDVPSSADFVLNFDWEKNGDDSPYFTIQSDTSSAGSPPSGEKKFIFIYANNDEDIRYSLRYGSTQQNDVNSSGTNFGNNVIGYFQVIKSGNSLDYSRYGSDADRASQTNALQSTATVTLPSDYTSANDFRYIGHGFDGSAGTNTLHNVEIWIGSDSTTGSIPIISATGLTDNTSTAQHYAVTRDSSNGWVIYQNGVSKSTATDATSLGANSVSGTATQSSDNENTNVTAGECSGQAFTSSATIYGKTITSFDMDLKRNGSETGTLQMGVFDGQTCDVKTLFRTIDATTLPTSYASYSSGTGSHTIATGEVVGIKWATGSGSEIKYASQNTEVYDGTNSYNMEMGSALTTRDAKFTINYAEVSDYTTNLSGSLDEFFVNSDTLTSTEIANINVRGATPTLLTTTTAGTTNYDDSTVVGGNNYYFSIQAVNSVGSSPYITPFVSGLAGTPADPPSSVASTISNPNTAPLDITVSWSAPTNVGSGTLTGFEIYRDGTLLTTTGLITSYTDTVPTGGGTFEYKLKSLSTHGTSGFSSTTSTTTPTVPPTPTATPTLAITNPNPSPLDIDVSWLAQSSGGSTITGYEIFRSADDITFTSVGTVTDLDFTDTVPSAGTWYYTFASTNLVGASGQSPSSNIATPTIPSSDSTTTLNIINPNPSPLDITVSLVSPSSNGGSAITGYNIFSSPDDITYTQVSTNVNTAQTITVANSGTWYFKSQALNNVGTATSQGSAVSIATPTVPPAPASSSSVINDVDTAPYVVNLSWTLPSSTGGSDLTGYNVYRQTGSGALSLITTTTALSYIDTVPTALNQAYTYNIHAVNNVGESTLFTTTTITTSNVPDAPVLSSTTGTTSLSWTVPSSDASITGYEIYRDTVLLTTVTTTTHSDFTTINFGQSYAYDVKAVSSLGSSVLSNTIISAPETEITGMIAQGITGTGAVIDWDEPVYYQGQITNYEVYYSEITASVTTPTTSAGTTTNTYSNFAPTLNYNTTYIFGVKVISPLGNSGFSNYVTVTTNIDGSITSADPDTGGVAWFDIDAVNEDSLNVIKFVRETQVIGGNNTDTLQVGYPSWWDSMTCDVDYKFAQKTEQYIEGEDMTAVVNPNDANQQVIGFAFQDIDNEVIEVECAPQQSTQDDGASGKYVMTQNDLATGLPSIPLVTQINNFSTGEYGTDGDFGALNIVGLFVILVSMVGFNRVSPIVGVLISASMIFVLAWFGIITIPYVIVGVIALVIFLAWGVNRKR